MKVEAISGIDGALIRAHSLSFFVRKVIGELSDARQFTDSNRRVELLNRGIQSLASAIRLSIDPTEIIAQRIRGSFAACGEIEGSLLFAVSQKVPLSAVVFPDQSRIMYLYPGYTEWDGLPRNKARIAGPTYKYSHLRSLGYYPSEGYADSNGVAIPFAQRNLASQIQHGGILVDNRGLQVDILNYDSLRKHSGHSLSQDEILMEANWYMDSGNQDKVVSRRNLQERRPYNCIGVFYFNDGKRQYFTLNFEDHTSRTVRSRLSLEYLPVRYSTMKEIAAMSNVLADMLEARSWALAGLEYNSGGTQIDSKWHSFAFNQFLVF